MTTSAVPPIRRVDLDWVRILAFALLILYHSGMYYVDWDWHVKSPHASAALQPWMMLTSPWRLGLLFFVSGCAAAFFLRRREAGTRARAFLRERTQRLLIPLAFGIWFIVPPQSFFEVVEKISYPGSYLEFLHAYASGYGGFCRGADCLRIPTWNHLWFVAYLWVYALLLALALRVLPRPLSALRAFAERTLHGWRALVLPALALGAIRLALVARFPATHALVDDFYNHAQYVFLFGLGVVLAQADAFWETLRRARWGLLVAAVLAWAALVTYFARFVDVDPPEALRLAMRALYGIDQWLAPAAALAFARQWNPRESAARRYFTEAVFPFYIVHQTAIVLFAEALKPLALRAGVEAPILVACTVAACFASFEIVRRVAWLRPLFGLLPREAQGSASPATDLRGVAGNA